MRDYGKVAPQFWTGATGKALKAAGPEAVIVALYLMTSPHANMIGVYFLPKLYLAYETGLGIEGASKGLARAIEAGFCEYDEASEHVFVYSMARFQVGDSLNPGDKRCKGVENELAKLPKIGLVAAFRARYAEAFHLLNPQTPDAGIEGASKPLASQEQEQEKEKEQEKEHRRSASASPTFSPSAWLEAKGVDEAVRRDFIAHRKAKKAPLTLTALEGIEREAGKARLELGEALRTCCERGWQGFKAEWVTNNPAQTIIGRNGVPHSSVPTKQRQML